MLRFSLTLLGGGRGKSMKRPVVKGSKGRKKGKALSGAGKKRAAGKAAAAAAAAAAAEATAMVAASASAAGDVAGNGAPGAGGAAALAGGAGGAAGASPAVLDVSPHRGYASYRLATAVSTVVVPPAANRVLESMKQLITPANAAPGGASTMEEYYTSRKGPLFATAVIAGTHAVKQASTLVPFCHPVPIHKCSFTFRRRVLPRATLAASAAGLPHRIVLRKRASPPSPVSSAAESSIIYCFCTVATDENKGGVELEALTGATVAGITLYDMLKGLPGAQEDGLAIAESFILAKRGGRNDFIKLLMSEPDRPRDPAAAPGADVPLIEGTKGSADAAAAAAAAAGAALKGSATAGKAPADEEADAGDEAEATEEEEDEEEDAEVPLPARRQVVRKSAGAAPGEAGGATEMEGAWWRSTRKEKRLQEKFPRRKYGDGARVSPEAVLGSRAQQLLRKHRVGEEDDTGADAAEEEEEEAAAPAKKTRGPAKGKRPTAKARAAAAKAEAEAEAEAEVEEEEEAPTAAGRGKSRKTSAKAGKGTRKALPADDDDAEVSAADKKDEQDEEDAVEAPEEEEEEAPAPRGKKGKKTAAAAAASSNSAKASRRAAAAAEEEDAEDEAAEEEETEAAEEEAEEEEEEEAPVAPKGAGKGGKAAGKMRAVKHDSWDTVTTKTKAGKAARAAAEEPEEPEEAEEAEEADEEDEAPPPPPKKKKLLKKKR